MTIPEAWRQLGLPGKPSKSCHSPIRAESHPSFSVFNDGSRFKDHGTGDTGDVVDFVALATGKTKGDAARLIIEWASTGPTAIDVKATWPLPKPEPEQTRKPVIPSLSPLTLSEVNAIQAQRKLPFSAGIEVACQRGLIFSAMVPHKGTALPCWVATDDARRNAQARRKDGQPFGDGSFKAKTLRGCSASWPIGAANLGNAKYVLLAEGPPDMLAAITLAWYYRDGDIGDIGFVCVTGAKNPLHLDALPLFAGRKVRIVYDADKAGLEGAKMWEVQLEGAGVEVDGFKIRGMGRKDGLPAKDLNDVCWLVRDDGEHRDHFPSDLERLVDWGERSHKP